MKDSQFFDGGLLPSGEPQYREVHEDSLKRGPVRLGHHSAWTWRHDAKRLGFVLAHYKFVAKMLRGLNRVLEVGCGDGFYTRVVAQEVGAVTAVDFDEGFIESAKETLEDHEMIFFQRHDITRGKVDGLFDAWYAIDFLEHIQPELERDFLDNACASLRPNGVAIVGTPSLESQQYATRLSKAGHVNCKTQEDLRLTMCKYFNHVFMFGMNDEVLHTGYGPMCHFNFALCCQPSR